MPDSDMIGADEAEEREIRIALMRADLDLKRKQGFWETPRNLVIVVGTIVTVSGAIIGAVGGWIGYQIGQEPQRPIIVQMVPPTR